MSETLIARTYAEGLRPLGAAAQRNHALITDAVAARLSPAHALLFCEPVTTPDGVATDWYAQASGVVRRLDELGSQEGEAARRRLGELVGDILSIADEFEAGGTEADRRLAEALRNAAEVPDGTAIWLVGDQPVLVTWAHSRDIDKAPRGIIRTFIPAKPPPPSQPAPQPVIVETREPLTFRDVLWWFGWLVLAALVFWAFWLLVAPCALRGPGFLAIDACPSSLASEIRAETDRQAALDDRVAMLERDLARTGRACPQPVPLQPPPELNAQLEPPEPDPDALDAEKWEDKDISVLEGCWGLSSDYQLEDRTTGEIVSVQSWEMCFDSQGNGDQQIVMSDGADCTADTLASFVEDGRLQISDLGDVQCTGGVYIYRRIMHCELEPNGEAACITEQPETGSRSELRITNRVPQ